MYPTKHTSVALPEALQQVAEDTIAAHPELGYTAIAEFCKNTIRTKILEMNNSSQQQGV